MLDLITADSGGADWAGVDFGLGITLAAFLGDFGRDL